MDTLLRFRESQQIAENRTKWTRRVKNFGHRFSAVLQLVVNHLGFSGDYTTIEVGATIECSGRRQQIRDLSITPCPPFIGGHSAIRTEGLKADAAL